MAKSSHLFKNLTWSIIGINPIARARRKVLGSTGSYTTYSMDVRVPKSKLTLRQTMQDWACGRCVCVRACMCVKGGKPASVPRHPSDHCLHKGFLGWNHSCVDKQLMSTVFGQPFRHKFSYWVKWLSSQWRFLNG